MFDNIKMFGRYGWGLNGYLSCPLTDEECNRRLTHQLRTRDESFLRILERGIYANPQSPYRKLLRHAGIEYAHVARLVGQHGVEGALSELYKSGVYVTLNEFKGRRPIERPGLQFAVHPQDFDNPLLAKHYEAQSSGSRGAETRVVIDLDLLTHEAAYVHCFLTAFDLTSRPIGTWHSVPPISTGMRLILRYSKLDKSVERWFTQSKLKLQLRNLKFFLFTNYTVYVSRILGRPLPLPEYVPLEKALKVALWLATKKEEGTPAVLHTNASSGVRVCLAAKEQGLDISGSFFSVGGEPYTSTKAKIMAERGSRAVSNYGMAEIGTAGIPCATPTALDDVHLLTDKVAVIQYPKSLGAGGLSVGALIYTTILPSCPKLMLNVESGDYGVLEDRLCGCPFGELGFSKHISLIRSYEKLTSEGVTFIGTELLRLVEEVLPTRFGGHPTDYQLVEEEEDGLPKVNILVSPRVGGVIEESVVATVLKTLSTVPGGDTMSELWRQTQTLQVVRREPYATASAKILPLHLLQKGGKHD